MAVSPKYTIHQYRDDMFKVVAFKGNRDPDVLFLRRKENQVHNEVKLANNYSRARSMILQYALCNPWDHFFTGTLDKQKYNRYQLDRYASQLMQWIRDKRKSYNAKFQVLLIPEPHHDGAWHMHGLIYGLPDQVLRPFRPPEPQALIRGGFLNWPDYQKKFGFCSLAPIKDPVATAYYITKYVSKDLSRRSGDLGKHLYFHSRPLNKADPVSDVYFYDGRLDRYCTNDFDFVKTGMVHNAPWYFPYQWYGSEPRNVEPMDPPEPELIRDPLRDFDPGTIDPFYEQIRLF